MFLSRFWGNARKEEGQEIQILRSAGKPIALKNKDLVTQCNFQKVCKILLCQVNKKGNVGGTLLVFYVKKSMYKFFLSLSNKRPVCFFGTLSNNRTGKINLVQNKSQFNGLFSKNRIRKILTPTLNERSQNAVKSKDSSSLHQSSFLLE